MEKLKDVKLIVFVVTMVLFTAVYFVTVNKISYAFETDYDVKDEYNTKIDTIKACATKYGESNPELFKEEDTIYIKVNDLVTANLLATNYEGNVIDPITSKVMNETVIKIKKEKETITAEVS